MMKMLRKIKILMKARVHYNNSQQTCLSQDIEQFNIFRTFMPKEIFQYMRDKTNYSRDESGESIVSNYTGD